jgi:omega-hydroxy-beta-dihydromenaquinone-9 sulfotransferase
MLGGVTLGNWLRILRDNHFSLDVPFWPRAAIITLGAVPNSIMAVAERWRYGSKVDRTEVEPPLFILGTWRSGTTHLHNLLAQDTRFAYPNLYQVTYPLTFLLSERAAAWLIELFVPKQRPQDAVKIGINEPQEEDFAMCSMAGQTNLLSWGFPRNAEFYDRYMTLAELSADELARWKSDYRYFLKKLTYKYRRPLVLKSPANTGRIKTLLEMFPDAKFVHIRRNPYDVFQSHKHTLRTAGPWWQLQRVDYQDDAGINRRLLRQTRILYESYFAERSLIRPGRLHEIGYEDLERDPIGQIREIYKSLLLPDFEEIEKRLAAYVKSISDYKKNILKELPDDVRQQVYRQCRQCFDEWGYAA